MNEKPQASLFPAILVAGLMLILLIHSFIYGLLIHKPAVEASKIFWNSLVLNQPMDTPQKLSILFTSGLLCLILILIVFILVSKKQSSTMSFMKNRFTSYKGTASWANLRDYYKLLGKDGFLLGKAGLSQVRLNEKASCEHLMVVGPTGCGKTSSFIIPNILDLPINCSAVVTDPKGEIAKITEATLIKKGFNILKFNPIDPENSDRYNPLHIAKDDVEIAEIAEITLRNGYSSAGQSGDSQWVTFSLPLWEFCLLVEKQTVSTRPPSIQGALQIATQWDESSREQMAKALGGKANLAYKIYSQSLQSPETAASIRTVLTTSVKLFTRSDIEKVTAGEGFDPIVLREKPTVLFIQIPERKAELMKPFTATMYWQLLEHIIDVPGLPIFFFMDEFANIGKIPGFAQIAATVRSRKIALCIALQGVEQLSREYSKEEQKDIINNMKTKLFYPGLTGETGELCQQIAGYTTVSQDSEKFFVSLTEDKSKWESRPLLTADELRRIPDGYALLLAHNINPLLIKTVPYFEDRQRWINILRR